MSFLEYRVKTAPTGFGKVLALNWALVLVVTAVAAIGWLMLSASAVPSQGWLSSMRDR